MPWPADHDPNANDGGCHGGPRPAVNRVTDERPERSGDDRSERQHEEHVRDGGMAERAAMNDDEETAISAATARPLSLSARNARNVPRRSTATT
jgi:hypothetical protein